MALPLGLLYIVDQERECDSDESPGKCQADRARDGHREKCLWGAKGK